jgi:hypothetical protein
MKSEWMLVGIAGVAVALYLGSLFVLPLLEGPEKSYNVDGLRLVSSQPPREALRTLFAQPDLRLRLDLYEGSDERNRAIAAMGSEIAAAFGGMDRELGVYGTLNGVPDGCDASNGNCTGAKLIVRYGPCNCVRINETMTVEGDNEFLKENVVKMRGIIRLVLTDLGPAAPPAPSSALTGLAATRNAT